MSAPLGVRLRSRLGSDPRVGAVVRRLAKGPVAEAERQVEQLVGAVDKLHGRHYGGIPLPPEELRLHVGTNASVANFLAQGVSSSQRVLEVFGEAPEEPVLDWGCGTGRTRRWLDHYPAWRAMWHGADVDAEAIEWLRGAGVDNVAVCDDDPPTPYPEAHFCGAYAFSVLTHIPAAGHRAWYEELRRIIRPGGLAYLTYQGQHILDVAGPGLPDDARRRFAAEGHAYVEHEGHYKDAAFVSEEFTRRALDGLFEIESFEPAGYQNMDAVLARAAG